MINSDYIDEDVAYLLGMLYGRGQLIEQGDVRRLIITLNIRRLTPKLPPDISLDMDLEVENERALNLTRRRVNDLLDANVDILPIGHGKATISAVFTKRTIAWRDLKMLCSNGTDHHNFRLPDFFFFLDGKTLFKEFLRGFADVAVTPSFADNAFGRKARVAFPVVNRNIQFAKQLIEVFRKVGVNASLLEGTPKKRGGKKEHRIRIYADEYEPIGFSFQHKQRLLKILADYNRDL